MFPKPLPLLAITALLVGACAAPAGGDLGTVAPPGSSGAASIDVPSPEPTPAATPAATPGQTPAASPGATTTVRAYFMLGSHTGTGGLVPVLRTIPKTQAVGAAAMTQLLAGPVGGELSADPAMFTDIPADARFLSLTIASGVATVNVSSEFAAGGTSATIEQRYGQVVFTLTQFPTVKSVRFQLDGADAPAVTDAGPVSRPVTRQDYVAVIPAIFVDGPAWGGAVTNPARITGLANAFEAQFRLQLLGPSRVTLADVAVHASCGTGCWGTFDVTVPYSVAAAQWGTLRVFEISSADSKPVNVTEYPVWLTPGS
jgi:hypothetical protein